MNYRILEDAHAASLAYQVRQDIAAGWEPLGGVSVAVDGSGQYLTFAQAMIRPGESHQQFSSTKE